MPGVREREQRVQFAPGEGRALRRALHLDEVAAGRSSPRSCRCRRRSPRRSRGRAPACPRRCRRRSRPPSAQRMAGTGALGDQCGTASCSGHEGAGDRRSPRAAVGLDHVAVDRDGALAERFRSTTARRLRPIRRWISCVRPTLPWPPRARPRVWVERGSMPYSAVTQPWPVPRRNARHARSRRWRCTARGVAELDQHRTFGMPREVARDGYPAQLVGLTAAGS